MPNDFSNIDINFGKQNHVAVAQYGGPIAITKNKDYFNISNISKI